MTRKRLTITAVVDATRAFHLEDNYIIPRLIRDGLMAGADTNIIFAGYRLYEPYLGDALIHLDVQISDPPHEWKFGDIVTQDCHPEGDFRAWSIEDGKRTKNVRDLYAEELWDFGPWRLVWVEGQDL